MGEGEKNQSERVGDGLVKQEREGEKSWLCKQVKCFVLVLRVKFFIYFRLGFTV